MPHITLRSVTRHYGGPVPTAALRGVTLEIQQGEFVAIEGPSGGGKSTLLNLIGMLDAPSSGQYVLGDAEVAELPDAARSRARSDNFAFIFQNFHLLDRRAVRDSVELGLVYRGIPRAERAIRAEAALEAVGLRGMAEKPANTLSGGQRQRVAIARALASGAPIVVADEPTGNLDSENSALVIQSLRRLQDLGATIVMVTHSPDLASAANRRLRLVDGHLAETTGVTTPATMSHAAPSAVPGRPSTVRTRDLLRDALRSLTSRVGRTAALVCAVALGVGLAVATAGVSLSARAQVSDAFDAHLNRDVSIGWELNALDTQSDELRDSIDDRLEALSGVDSAAMLTAYPAQDVQVNLVRPTFSVAVYSMTSHLPEAARTKIRWAAGHAKVLGADEVLVGTSLASQLNLGPLDARPTMNVAGRTLTVAGLMTQSPRVPEMLGSVMVTTDSGKDFMTDEPVAESALLLTQAGAAQQVAAQAPQVVNPYQPETLTVSAPIDPATLRNAVEGSIQATLLIVTAVALLGSIAGLANSMTLAVAERRQEIGLRRALGALPRQIAALIFVESAIVGVLGGIIGLAAGLAAILTATISQHWIPVFDLALAPAAILGGVVVGALGGVLASARASRIQPNDALRL